MNRPQLKRRWTVMLAILTSPLPSETMLILPDRRLIAWEILFKEGVTQAMLPKGDPTALSENDLMAPFAGVRVHEEKERAAALLALVDAARRRSEG
jgi:hypothetical protein